MEDENKDASARGAEALEAEDMSSEEILEGIEKCIEEFEELQRQDREFFKWLEDLIRGMDDIDLADDATVKLVDVPYLPLLGGRFTESEEFRRRSRSVTEDNLRRAVKAGVLKTVPGASGKNIITRVALVREWLEGCASMEERSSGRPTSVSADRRKTWSRPRQPAAAEGEVALRSAHIRLQEIKDRVRSR